MKRVAILTITIMIMFLALPAYANNDSSMNFIKAKQILISKNREIKKLEKIEQITYSQYQTAMMSAKDLDTEGMTYEINGSKQVIKFDTYMKILAIKRKELMPQQLESAWRSAFNNTEILKRNLNIMLRENFSQLVGAINEHNNKKKIFELTVSKANTDKKKYVSGALSLEDFDQSQFALMQAKEGTDTAKRNWENACRNFNLFLGAPLGNEYFSYQCLESINETDLNLSDEYVGLALKKRKEILDLNSQIRLKELEMEIIKKDNANTIYTDLEEDYKNGQEELEELKFKLEKARYDIEYEIRAALADLRLQRNSLSTQFNNLRKSRINLDKVRTQFKQHLISQTMLDEAEISGLKNENDYNQAIYQYNTKVLKFENAISLGPAY